MVKISWQQCSLSRFVFSFLFHEGKMSPPSPKNGEIQKQILHPVYLHPTTQFPPCNLRRRIVCNGLTFFLLFVVSIPVY